MNIILDTNIIRKDFFLKSNHFKIFLDFVYKTGSTIIIPKIVLRELVSLYKKELSNQLNNTKLLLSRLDDLLIENRKLNQSIELDLDQIVKEYEQYISKKLDVSLLRILEHKDSYLSEIIRRSIERIKPISAKGEEFRDTVLWLSILDFLSQEKNEETIFISNNLKDFADESQMILHPDLQNDLQKQNSKLKFYKSIGDFIKNIAVKIDFITNDWLVDNLDWTKLNQEAKAAIISINSAFFYEYYHQNNVDKNSLEDWKIISANFDKYIEHYFIYKLTVDELYKVEIHLNGQAQVRFVNNLEQVFDEKADFYTATYITVKKDKIIYTKDSFFEEDTGLHINKAYYYT